ncbi:MAG: hypothetical protein WAW86_05940 [Gammaproteobacteria bacterium]
MDLRKDKLDIQFDQLPTAANGFVGFSIEAINLLIELEQHRRLVKSERPFNCYVYEVQHVDDEAVNLADLLGAIRDFAANVDVDEGPSRLQLIVKNVGHYTGIDIQISREGNECLILDAGSDLRVLILICRLGYLTDADGQNIFRHVYWPSSNANEARLQTDINSCPLFTFDHVCQSSKLDIFIELGDPTQTETNEVCLTWNNMPPELVWNAQSLKLLADYRKHNAKKYFGPDSERGANFDSYLEQGKKAVLSSTGEKVQNHSIERLFQLYREQYLSYKGVNLPSRLQLGSERLANKSLDFNSPINLMKKLLLIVHSIRWDDPLPDLLKKMRLAATMEDFKFLANLNIKMTISMFGKKTIPNRFIKLCNAIRGGDEKEINKMYIKMSQKTSVRKKEPIAESSSSNANKTIRSKK